MSDKPTQAKVEYSIEDYLDFGDKLKAWSAEGSDADNEAATSVLQRLRDAVVTKDILKKSKIGGKIKRISAANPPGIPTNTQRLQIKLAKEIY